MKAAAEARLLALVDSAITRIGDLIDNGENDTVRLSAAKDALDRAGFKPVDKKQIGGDPANPLRIEVEMVGDRA